MSASNARILNTALYVVATEARLAAALGVALQDLQKWLRNEADAPGQVILRALDIIEKGPVRYARAAVSKR
jgi:DNA-binding transcriptional regulator YiaG